MKKNISIFLVLIFFATLISKASHFIIYPTPQSISYKVGKASIGKVINVVWDKDIDKYTLERAKEVFETENAISLKFSNKPSKHLPNLFLGIYGSKGYIHNIVEKQKLISHDIRVSGKYDSHFIDIVNKKNKTDIYIVGEHTNAVYHALATLEQVLDQCDKVEQNTALTPFTIYDFADMKYRGIVEGFYGYPYSFAVKRDLMNFFKRYKMNTYLYGAKSDPYHSGFWRESYPEQISSIQEKNGWLSKDMIKSLARLSLETKVNFIWAIHPNSGKAVDFGSPETTRKAENDVLGKFEQMHSLGVRQFAVFLDDAGWNFNDVDNYRDFLTNLQSKMEQKYNKNFVNESDTILPLHFVPHIYAINFTNKKNLKTYFDAISQTPEKIVVYTTGSGVWSSVKNEDFVTMNNLMKRPVALWWNYPCNDNKDGRIYTADMYSTLKEMGLQIPDSSVPQCLGLVSNPMQQGEVAKICLFGVADYSWNTSAFNTEKNWNASFSAIVGNGMSSLYKFLAKYLRFQDPEELHALIEQFKSNNDDSSRKQLTQLFKSIQDSTSKMLSCSLRNSSDSLLRNDLKPWLCKLNKMSEVGVSLLNLNNINNEDEKWLTYCNQLSVLESFKYDTTYMVATLEGMGENPPSELHKVEPSHKYMMPFLEYLLGQSYPKGLNKLRNTCLSIFDKGNEAIVTTNNEKVVGGVYYINTSAPYRKLMPRESAIISFPRCGVVNDAFISKDIFNRFIVSKSEYGKDFDIVKNNKQLVDSRLKFIKLENKTKTPQSLDLSKSNLRIVMPTTPNITSVYIPEGNIWGNHDGQKLIDSDYNTFTCLYRDQRDGDAYTVKLNKEQPIYDVTIAFGTTNLDFPKVGKVQISSDSINWKNLHVINSETSEFRMSMPQVQKVNDDISCCSFVNDGSSAQYVRFIVKESFQERWLRLNEIVVNSLDVASKYAPVTSVNNKENIVLSDGKYNTMYFPETDDDKIEHNLFGLTRPEEVIVYANKLVNENSHKMSEVQVLNNGKRETLGTLKAGINRFDLRKFNNAEKVIISIFKKSFSIAEIEYK